MLPTDKLTKQRLLTLKDSVIIGEDRYLDDNDLITEGALAYSLMNEYDADLIYANISYSPSLKCLEKPTRS